MKNPMMLPAKARACLTGCLLARINPYPKRVRTIAPDHCMTIGFDAIVFSVSIC